MGIVVLILSLVAQFLFIVQLRVHPPTHPRDQPVTHPSPFATALCDGPGSTQELRGAPLALSGIRSLRPSRVHAHVLQGRMPQRAPSLCAAT